MRNPIIVALDVPTGEEALKLVEELSPVAGGFKVGSELFTSAGPDVARRIRDMGAPVFRERVEPRNRFRALRQQNRDKTVRNCAGIVTRM